ncbi:MAG TPA: ATP-binding protein [Burkholderiales bacterium]|nr:ATP-binding protein [Burkholderiales bacterium]
MALELKQVESALTHDLNNFLQVILGNLELLKRRGELVPEIVEAALAATRQAGILAERLGAIGRLRRQELRSLEVNRLLAELAPLLERTVGPAIRLELKLASDAPAALADPQSLQLALLELATNARNAMPAGGRLAISTAAAGSFVRISLADTGCGMPPRPAEPTGLGLEIVEQCMTLAGGRMELDSTDMGTTAKLYLPVAT